MSELAPETRLWNMLRGALATRALAVVADLRVAEVLADGPRPVEEIAEATGADADVLHRLLRALASDGVFAQEAPRVFGNTPASDLLRTTGWRDFAHLFGGVWLRTTAELDARGGPPAFARLFGSDFWTWLRDQPEERTAFDRAMEQGKESRIERLASLDWRDGETVVDVGGGNGSLLRTLFERRPDLNGIVFDLPETVRDEAALGERISFVEGSFFDGVPRGGVYVLSTILHDWDDPAALSILRAIRAAAPAGGRLVVIDAVVQQGDEPQGAKWLDLLMHLLFGARERDEAQWRALLDAGGFEPVRIADGLIEARCR